MANRLLTINIRNYLVKQPRRKRPARIARYVRLKIAGAVKMKLESVKLTGELNEVMLKKHLHSMLPLKVSINVEKDKATASPFGVKPKPTTLASTTGKPKSAEHLQSRRPQFRKSKQQQQRALLHLRRICRVQRSNNLADFTWRLLSLG